MNPAVTTSPSPCRHAELVKHTRTRDHGHPNFWTVQCLAHGIVLNSGHQYGRADVEHARRLADEHNIAEHGATVCDICRNGCNCEAGTPGCEHFACWGLAGTDSCTGVAIESLRLAAAFAA